jgi:hypothetical protein
MNEPAVWKKLSGVCYNQLGSRMSLHADQNDSLSGEYKPAVGNAQDFYILTGRFDAWISSSQKGVSIGWVVTYHNDQRNAHSTATWSGQYFDGGDERIITHWLLTSNTTPKSVWRSTNVGNDTFTRKKPGATEIARAQALTVGSPHSEDIIAY